MEVDQLLEKIDLRDTTSCRFCSTRLLGIHSGLPYTRDGDLSLGLTRACPGSIQLSPSRVRTNVLVQGCIYLRRSIRRHSVQRRSHGNGVHGEHIERFLVH